jgi:hypothetical protein
LSKNRDLPANHLQTLNLGAWGSLNRFQTPINPQIGCGGGSINSVKRSNNPPKKGAQEMRGTNVHTFVPRNAWYKCVAIDTPRAMWSVAFCRLPPLRQASARPAVHVLRRSAQHLQPGREPQCDRCVGLHFQGGVGELRDLCAQKIGKSRDHMGVAIYLYKKDPTPGPRRPKDPRRKGFASFDRVYTSSSAPQCERIPIPTMNTVFAFLIMCPSFPQTDRGPRKGKFVLFGNIRLINAKN